MKEPRYQGQLERHFGVPDPKLRGVAATPNDLSPALVLMCRALATTSTHEMMCLVDYLLAEWHGAEARDFAEFLFRWNGDPARWRHIQCLFQYPKVSEDAWSVLSVTSYLRRLEVVAGERWYVSQSPKPRLHTDNYVLGIVLRDMRYYEAPVFPGIVGGQATEEQLRRVSDAEVPIAIRRLIAKRLGWQARTLVQQPGAIVTFDGLIAAAHIDIATLSHDARISLNAIVEEMRESGGGIEHADRCIGEGPAALYVG